MPGILAIPAAFLAGGVTQIAAGAGATLATQAAISTTATSLFTGLLGLGLTVGLSVLLRPEVPDPQNGQIETQQSIPPRTFVYGRMEISGPIAFKERVPGTNILQKIVLLNDGEIDAWETLKLDDIVVVLDPADGTVLNAFIQDAVNRVKLFLYNGTADQAASTELLTNFPDIWTTDHRLRGIAYVVCHFHGTGIENFQGAYPNGEPTFKAVVRGRRVWDYRDPAQSLGDPTTWTWSDNPALCILDWIAHHPKGYKVPLAKLDIASFLNMANRCDELIPLNSGGAERRYRVATQVSLKEPRTAVLQRLRESCDGHLYITGEGKWALRGGNWTAPDVTLDTKLGHILDQDMRDGMDALTRYNELALTFLSPNHNYAGAECDAWQNTADLEFIAGKVKTRELDLLQVPSFTQARRLAKIMMAYDNPSFVGSVRSNFFGLNAIGARNVQLNWSEEGESTDIDGPFWVEPNPSLVEDGTGMQLGVRSADPTAYDWDPATEEGEAVPLLPPPEIDVTEGTPPANPADFAVVGGARQATASWTVPADVTWYIGRLWRADHYVNNLLQSDDHESATWTKSVGISPFGSGSVANTTDITDPEGGTTANFIRYTTETGADFLRQSVALAPNQSLTWSQWMRHQVGGPKYIRMIMADSVTTGNFVACFFDLEARTAKVATNAGAASGATAELVVRPDGWMLCILHGTPSTSGTATRLDMRPSADGVSNSFTGDNIHGAYVWRGQLEIGAISHQPLLKTTTAASVHPTFASAVEVSGPRYKVRNATGTVVWPDMEFVDPVKAGAYDYFFTSENAVGDRAAPLGPVHVTVTAT